MERKEELRMRNYAHLGDAVWELFVREHMVELCNNPQSLHRMTTERVMAAYQAQKLGEIEEDLTEKEKNIMKRARNMEVPIARRNNQNEYRLSTAFEALMGYWYREDRERLQYFFDKLLQDLYD